MAFEPKSYNSRNYLHQSHANSLMDYILKENPQKVYDIIVDIGSGSGNVTKTLSQRIPHKKIIAFDISPDMIEFAKANYSSDTIEYLIEDIGKPWDQLNNTFKALEGKVSLVFSNRVLYWVENKENAAKNISKLLAINGDICANMTPHRDLSPYLSPEFNEDFMKVPNIEEQFEMWITLFTKYGIEFSFADNFEYEGYFDRNAISALEPATNKMYLMYIKNPDPDYREKVINEPIFKNAVNLCLTERFCWKEEIKPNCYSDFIKSDAKGITAKMKKFRYIGKKVFKCDYI